MSYHSYLIVGDALQIVKSHFYDSKLKSNLCLI